jgi:pyridoxamine 5'-phosphate oxidase
VTSDHGRPLRERDLATDPLSQFAAWERDAREAAIRMPEAAALATASPDGVPSVRMVLVKGFDERGFVFFTNYTSAKGRELERNPRAALMFYWDPLGRQVRIAGPVARTSAAESDRYAHSRARGSQLSALASPQSQAVASRAVLERRVAELERQFGEGELPRSEHWGGFRVAVESVEFWQQRSDRLHDRLRYRRDGGDADGGWTIERLAP